MYPQIKFTFTKFMCGVCERIEMIKKGTNPYFVKEMETGYVVIGDNQFFKGYTLFLCKEHKTELFELDRTTKVKLPSGYIIEKYHQIHYPKEAVVVVIFLENFYMKQRRRKCYTFSVVSFT